MEEQQQDIGDLLSFVPTVSYTISPEGDDNHQSSTRVYDRYYFHSSSSSDDDESEPSSSSAAAAAAASKRLDYMVQYLDRKLSSSPTNYKNSPPLPEFTAGAGTGIFTPPVRSISPTTPPCLELRPQPLRETQVGKFLRNIVCTESQLWAGTECGIRVWNFRNLYELGDDEKENGTAPFGESVECSGVMCIVGDEGNRLVWSGHKDGKIRAWKMDGIVKNGFKEVLSWQAHRYPVLSLVISSYGDFWSCSESEFIKVWPWEIIGKALSLTMEERHMAALLVERSYIDLRSQVTVNGYLNASASDTKYLLSDNSRAKVWSAGYLSFGLWDARSRELLKLFNIDGQIENRLDMSSVQEFAVEDEFKMKFAGPRKEKPQGPISFFQRSRNVIMGAADAVLRVATKGSFGDDNRRTEALVVTIDGMVWTGCLNGSLVQWDGNGNRLQEFQYHSFSVQCLCTFGSRIWVGYVSGTVHVLDLDGHLLGGWEAHSNAVLKMAVGMGYLFTLASHGGIRGWNITSPGPLDGMLRSELAGKEFLYTRLENLKILTGTWNVAQERASPDSLISWLASAASDVGIVVVGLQEVEMGAGVLAMSAARETVGLEGSTVGQWWLDMMGKTLDEGSTFERVGSRQLAGLLIGVWVRCDIKASVGDVDAAAVPCGFGHAIGNKGAVGLRMRVYDQIFCFVNCHFAAHLEAVNRRNADFDRVFRTMTFSRPSNSLNAGAVGVSSTSQTLRNTNVMGAASVDGKPELSEADMVVFLGDFNYRLDGTSYDEARDFVSQRCFDWLRERDQLRAEMQAGNVFQGMREAIIKFPPTYKFEKHQDGLAGYDSSEKKRIPAWCDRIVYRDSRSALASGCGLECPVVSSISQYDACMEVTDSDHKPVRCIFNVDIARVDESVRRQEFGEIIASNEKIKQFLQEASKIPDVVVSTNNIILQNQATSILRITNKSGKYPAFYEIICEGQSPVNEDGQARDHCPRGSFGFPRWLEATPASGIIKPDQIMEISVHHEAHQTVEEFVDGVPQNWWCEDNRATEVILVVKVRGNFTSETRNHRIRVRHCFPGKTTQFDSKPDNNPKEVQGNVGNLLQRSDIRWLSSSYDVVDKLKNLHSP